MNADSSETRPPLSAPLTIRPCPPDPSAICPSSTDTIWTSVRLGANCAGSSPEGRITVEACGGNDAGSNGIPAGIRTPK